MLLEKLSNARGTSGNEGQVRDILIEEVKGRVDEFRVDTIGNLITYKKAKGARRNAPKVMIAAHMDEVGLMVVHVDGKGYLKFSKVGGIDDRVLLSKVVLVGKDAKVGVIGSKPVHLTTHKEREAVVESSAMYIDIGAKSKEEALGSVRIGDYATFATKFAEMGDGLVKGKALDDRVGCGLLVDLLKRVYPFDLYGVFTVQEEVGVRGARVAAYAIEPDIAFALESTPCDDSPRDAKFEPRIRLGKGPAITIADRTTFTDPRLVKLLLETAKDNRIPYQIKQPMIGGTDVGRIHLSKEGVPSAVVSIPTRYIHSPVAVLDTNDLEHALALMNKALPKLTRVL